MQDPLTPDQPPTPAPSPDTPGGSADERHERFLCHYIAHQRQLHGYIAMFINSPADVNEVLQDTSVVLWRKFDQFAEGGSFLAWACGIARYEVYRMLRSQRRSPLQFDEQLLETLSADRQRMKDELEARREALRNCMGKLPDVDRTLINRCYNGDRTFKDVAQDLGRPVNSVYKSLGRIRSALLICIRRRLGLEIAR